MDINFSTIYVKTDITCLFTSEKKLLDFFFLFYTTLCSDSTFVCPVYVSLVLNQAQYKRRVSSLESLRFETHPLRCKLLKRKNHLV